MLQGTKTVAIPPGETIREQLHRRHMNQKDFAKRMDLSEKHISRLINGKVELTPQMALRLESVLGVPAGFWTNLESIYRDKIERVQDELNMEDDLELVRRFPYAKMASMRWVDQADKLPDRVRHLRQFFEVVKLRSIFSLPIQAYVCRSAKRSTKLDYWLAAWAQKASREARNIEAKTIDLQKLRDLIPKLRSMTKANLSLIQDELVDLFADCGVALVLLPHIPSSYLNGLSFLDGDRLVLGLTLRGKDADIFWFSLFHELHHLLENHVEATKDVLDEWEKEADDFARNALIPKELYEPFCKRSDLDRDDILVFSDSIDVSPGIVVGRLQKDGFISYNRLNDLKDQYEFEA